MNFCSLACGLTLELPEKTNTPCGPALEFYQWTEPPAPGTLSDKPLQPSSCYLIFSICNSSIQSFPGGMFLPPMATLIYAMAGSSGTGISICRRRHSADGSGRIAVPTSSGCFFSQSFHLQLIAEWYQFRNKLIKE